MMQHANIYIILVVMTGDRVFGHCGATVSSPSAARLVAGAPALGHGAAPRSRGESGPAPRSRGEPGGWTSTQV